MVSGKQAKRRRRRQTFSAAAAQPSRRPGVLADGWDVGQVRDRHMRYAKDLVEAGVTFMHMTPEDRPAVQRLVGEHITGAGVVGAEEGGVVARDAEGRLVGALVVAGVSFEDQEKVTLIIRHLVVEPDWRGRGVGVVQLGVLPQLLGGRRPDLIIGNCTEESAGFYQRAGFDVLEAGVPLPFPFGRQAMVQLSNQEYPCWFFRTY